jgi:hypothetical protein
MGEVGIRITDALDHGDLSGGVAICNEPEVRMETKFAIEVEWLGDREVTAEVVVPAVGMGTTMLRPSLPPPISMITNVRSVVGPAVPVGIEVVVIALPRCTRRLRAAPG